ncbi:MAG TPA: phosphomannomutase, partial [Byssovorax sp.]
MDIPRHIFREYDIRGVADVDLSDALAFALGHTFAAGLAPGADGRRRVAVGRDGRLSSTRLYAALTSGILASGADVLCVGIGPTPMLYFAAHHLATEGAMMITASHNPGPDNGFKMMRGTASFYGADIQALATALEAIDGAPAASGPAGDLREHDVRPAYIESVRSSSRLPEAARKLRIVVDGGNGSAGPLGIATLRALGFEPDTLFCDIDGR